MNARINHDTETNQLKAKQWPPFYDQIRLTSRQLFIVYRHPEGIRSTERRKEKTWKEKDVGKKENMKRIKKKIQNSPRNKTKTKNKEKLIELQKQQKVSFYLKAPIPKTKPTNQPLHP